MRDKCYAAVALALLVQSACASAADPRPRLTGVSAVRIANYGAPSVLIEGRERVNAIVEELNGLRKRPWRRADTQLSCYSHVVLLSGKRTVGSFRVRPEYLVERPVEKGETSHSLEIRPADLPRISSLLAEIPPAKNCQ